jgi:hypothetical protein
MSLTPKRDARNRRVHALVGQHLRYCVHLRSGNVDKAARKRETMFISFSSSLGS